MGYDALSTKDLYRMTRRTRLWAVCIVLGCSLLLVFHWRTGNETTTYQPREKEAVIIEAEKREEEDANEQLRRINDEEEARALEQTAKAREQKKPEEVEKSKEIKGEEIKFRGDIQTPKVNIEVNGHSIDFSEVHSRGAPERINIHLIFHSHVDPGWLETFEEYYQTKVKDILSNAVDSLRQYKDLRFIWSETSFLERWWRDATKEERANITEQISTGQLEISGGAWVMTDEATPTFYAAIQNMIEGHSFIKDTFNVTPKTSWSVDPFGHGAMMPELLHRAGVDAMVIGRFHDHVKEKLREKQAMRWRWIPPYFEKLEGPRVNSLPHLVYTTADACSDNNICFCYHVGASALYQSRCPEQTQITTLNPQNVEFITKRFVTQMRVSQMMYGEKDLLVPLGDDFFFGDKTDWQQMHEGFAIMIDWLNKHPEVNATMKFSTVSEFFDSIKEEKLWTFRGDFFPYTSNMMNPYPWWTGYFVQRPFAKTMERRLQNSLRALDLISALKGNSVDLEALTEAKRQLTLFQHHDGITGTSRPLVMEDYEKRMKSAFKIFTKEFIKTAADGKANLTYDGGEDMDLLVEIPPNSKLYLSAFSSQTFPSKSLIRILTSKTVKVETADGKEVPVQITGKTNGTYQVEFLAVLPPLSFTTFTVSEKPLIPAKGAEKCLKISEETGNIEGLMFQKELIPFNLSLIEVGDTGGAYTFVGSGTMKPVFPNISSEFDGVFQRVDFTGYKAKELKMSLTCRGDGDLQIDIDTDLSDQKSLLLVFKTKIKQKVFNTDVNGLYHIPRIFAKQMNEKVLPWEANIFPVATSVFVEDKNLRLTVAMGQPTGAIADDEGVLEILVDRRVRNDDGKGLGYNDCLDSRSSSTKYRLFLEKRSEAKDVESQHAFLSLKGEQTVMETLYPPMVLISEEPIKFDLKKTLPKWPCSIQLVSWRPLSNKIGVLILRKYNVDPMIVEEPCEYNSLKSLFDYFSSRYKSLHHAKLSAMVDEEKVTLESFKKSLEEPFSIASFRLHY